MHDLIAMSLAGDQGLSRGSCTSPQHPTAALSAKPPPNSGMLSISFNFRGKPHHG
jgi:hypothetical protein